MTLHRFVRTFFNKTPTVSFAPGETTSLKNGTIRGVIRGADADGDMLTYTAGPTTNGGTVAISTDGTFIYTPGAGFASKDTDTFLVTASDLAASNGWHIHGLLGLLMPSWQATATTRVTVGRAVTPTGPTIPTTPQPPNGVPPTNAQSAAAAYGWGAPDARLSDEFNGSGTPSATAWNLYRSPGHAGNGLRRPEQITVQDGYLQIAGTPNATSGGMMGSAVNPAYGRWEARMRVDKQGPGNPYHAVVALIPYGVPYNGGAGDVDFAEADVDEGRVYVFIHHPTNKQTYASTTLDLAAWHTYAIEVAPDHISWFVDGKITMTTTNRAAITGRQWTTNVQLDAFYPSGLAPSNMQVDYFRYYPLPTSGAPIVPGAAPNIGNYP
ncbi:family 16 glycosylhydrolase [Candidatus Mycolicibacterium alkanivorans]|uniref:Family 16 glycosylhydrolase n=1 Tax=Candidatus Mycolicibacterium alkanivorans TaxID=2954114 RepID=A0ABS9YTA4_9MYCO|nr:family 16 glycosylhydrolase [Candidatus Mycolicibacterium alkanivorans]MCI4674461.1 family 16 glycosylhydrolase [Candidatus Mycolicibacterium alkanivorans]